MDAVRTKNYILGSEALSPVKSPSSSSGIFGSRSHSSSSQNSFPIIAVAIIGILATAFLLLSYYIFVVKCCLGWHRIDLLRRFSFSRSRRRLDETAVAYSPEIESRGLDEAVIRLIPIFQFKKLVGKESSVCECSVCLNDFSEGEKLRIIPNCGHVFHIDCIDVWLQNNANCPLCRTPISAATVLAAAQFPSPPATSPQDSSFQSETFTGRDEDYVVIELGEIDYSDNQSLLTVQERLNSGEQSTSAFSISPSPRKVETKTENNNNTCPKKGKKKWSHVSSMGDECIDTRMMMKEKDDQFEVQPIRRSFSMDSARDRQLYVAVREILQRNNSQVVNETEVSSFSSNHEGCSSRVRRSFFPFGHARGLSRS